MVGEGFWLFFEAHMSGLGVKTKMFYIYMGLTLPVDFKASHMFLLLSLAVDLVELNPFISLTSVKFVSVQCTFQFDSFLDNSLVFLVILSSCFVTVIYHYL